MKYKDNTASQSFDLAGMFTLALRLVAGWTYFSAFWRRLILTNKLDPDTAGYIGEKFNHFLPNALLIKPGIEYLVSNEQILWWFMLVFTIVEGVVGLLFYARTVYPAHEYRCIHAGFRHAAGCRLAWYHLPR